MIYAILRLIRGITFFTIFFAHVVYAESIYVRTLDTDVDPKVLPLRVNQRGDLTVYLKSAGDVVDGFRVFLIRDSDNGLVESLRSDENGVVKFLDLDPEHYTVILRKTKSQRLISPTVAIGDLRLEVAPPGRVPAQRKEPPEEPVATEEEPSEPQAPEQEAEPEPEAKPKAKEQNAGVTK